MDEDRLKGAGKQVLGSIKDAVGKVTGDTEQAQGTAEAAAGKVQNTVGHAEGAVRDATRNRAMVSDGRNLKRLRAQAAGPAAVSDDRQVLTLHAEVVAVAKRVRKTLVRAARTTRTRDQVVEEDLARENVVVERVAINRVVDTMPAVRQEDDVTIVPVVEEVVVVTRQFLLKEEVHLRRVQTTDRHTETVALRQQEVVITRTDLEE